MLLNTTKSYPFSKGFLSGLSITLYEVVCVADIRVIDLFKTPRKAARGRKQTKRDARSVT